MLTDVLFCFCFLHKWHYQPLFCQAENLEVLLHPTLFPTLCLLHVQIHSTSISWWLYYRTTYCVPVLRCPRLLSSSHWSSPIWITEITWIHTCVCSSPTVFHCPNSDQNGQNFNRCIRLSLSSFPKLMHCTFSTLIQWLWVQRFSENACKYSRE